MDGDGMRRWLDERVAGHQFSGVALVWRDGAPVFEDAGGIAHGLMAPNQGRVSRRRSPSGSASAGPPA
jgi:hypothetical protein